MDTCNLNVVVAGHVDHGKSTIIGRLLADTDSLPLGKIEQIRAVCARNSKKFEYAFLLDALKDEQSQGITIDSARVFFKTKKRKYIIIDAPGHIEFLKNMVSGASRADAALLTVDAKEGVQENSRRHGYMLSFLGVKQIVVLVNKMDLVDFSRADFEKIKREYSAFLGDCGIQPHGFIPVSGFRGDNIAAPSPDMPWYEGPPLLNILDSLKLAPFLLSSPFRMPVQDVYKFTSGGDNRRVVVGTITSGKLQEGDSIIFYPSGKRSRVKKFEMFGKNISEVGSGFATAFSLEEQIFVKRGEVAALEGEAPPELTTRLQVTLFWMGRHPMECGGQYILKLGTSQVPMTVEQVNRIMDASDLSRQQSRSTIHRHEVADCLLKLSRPVAVDIHENMPAGKRFVVVEDRCICGGGIIQKVLEDSQSQMRKDVLSRNLKWQASLISAEQRVERLQQYPVLILITGEKEAERKEIAKQLELGLFNEGKQVYFLGMGNLVYGMDADLKGKKQVHYEHLRRLAEIANLFLEAGFILVVSGIGFNRDDLDVIRTYIGPRRIFTVWVGNKAKADISCDIFWEEQGEESWGGCVDKIRMLLDQEEIFFPERESRLFKTPRSD